MIVFLVPLGPVTFASYVVLGVVGLLWFVVWCAADREHSQRQAEEELQSYRQRIIDEKIAEAQDKAFAAGEPWEPWTTKLDLPWLPPLSESDWDRKP
jgi:hypothetical protein